MTHEWPLEPTPAALRRMTAAVLERLVEHLSSLPEQPAAWTEGAVQFARTLDEPLPEHGTSIEPLLDLLFDEAVPRSFNTAGPGYLAYIPGGGIFTAALADFLASGVNRYMGVTAAAPVLARLEANVLDWFRQIIGYPTGARGILTSGGSLANFSAVVTARSARLPEDFLAGTLYVSDQAHHSVAKAALLAGFPARAVRLIPSDDRFRIRIDLLDAAIAEDRRVGRRPFLVVGSAGTTNTGAVDPLLELADLARDQRLWFHVDAAYGGFFAMTERGRARLAGMDRADSIVLDPHKGLFLPYGTGALLVRDADALRRAHSVGAEYLPPMQDDPTLVDFCEISPELSRPFRGLAVWLTLRLHGASVFREALDEKLDLARWIADRLGETPGIQVVADPELSLLAFRVGDPGDAADAVDARTRAVLATVNDRKRVYITGTTVRGRFLARICVLSFRTHRSRMEAALEDILSAARTPTR